MSGPASSAEKTSVAGSSIDYARAALYSDFGGPNLALPIRYAAELLK